MYKAKYFKPEEFTCKCGCGLMNMDENLVSQLDAMREECGFPFKVNSGCRCKEHNDKIGGAKHSPHMPDEDGICHAVDIKVDYSRDRYNFIMSVIRVGLMRIGIASNFIHIDNMNDKNHVSQLLWHYKR